jgi:multicomponent Na+:H+ antiporter subunit D
MTQDVILTILSPLFGAFLAILAGWLRGVLAYPVGVIALGGSVFFAARVLLTVLSQGTLTYAMGGWAPPWGIVFQVDAFSAGVLLLIACSSLVVFLSFYDEITGYFYERGAAMVALSLLTIAGHMGIVLTGDLFNLYVLIEISALSGYALLGMGGKRSSLASLNYLVVGAVGASLYLLGVGYLYILTGSLNMADMANILASSPGTSSMRAAVVLLVLGLWVKMAVFPLHGWLPQAYAYSTPATAALMAPLTTKVMAYVVIRLILSVFPEGNFMPASVPDVAVILGTLAIFAGSIMAFRQKDLRRVLCYILVAEVGYMVGGTFIGNRPAMTGAMLHIFADMLMTATIFIAVSCIARQRGGMGPENLRGLFKTMPWTMAAVVVGALSMIGVPPFFGFFSKWYLLTGALQAGQYVFMAALLFSSLMNAVLFFRFFEVAFFEKPEDTSYEAESWTRVVPLALAVVVLVVAGLSTGFIVDRLITVIIPAHFV